MSHTSKKVKRKREKLKDNILEEELNIEDELLVGSNSKKKSHSHAKRRKKKKKKHKHVEDIETDKLEETERRRRKRRQKLEENVKDKEVDLSSYCVGESIDQSAERKCKENLADDYDSSGFDKNLHLSGRGKQKKKKRKKKADDLEEEDSIGREKLSTDSSYDFVGDLDNGNNVKMQRECTFEIDGKGDDAMVSEASERVCMLNAMKANNKNKKRKRHVRKNIVPVGEKLIKDKGCDLLASKHTKKSKRHNSERHQSEDVDFISCEVDVTLNSGEDIDEPAKRGCKDFIQGDEDPRVSYRKKQKKKKRKRKIEDLKEDNGIVGNKHRKKQRTASSYEDVAQEEEDDDDDNDCKDKDDMFSTGTTKSACLLDERKAKKKKKTSKIQADHFQEDEAEKKLINDETSCDLSASTIQAKSKKHKKRHKLDDLSSCSESAGGEFGKFLTGRFSKKEKEIVEKNLNRIALSVEAIDLQADLFNNVRLKNGETIPWSEFVKQAKIFSNALHGLQRTRQSLWNYLHSTKQTYLKTGAFSQDEVYELTKLQAKFGNKWSVISKEMCRNDKVIGMKWLNRNSVNKGTWTNEELERLQFAVCLLTGAEKGIPTCSYGGIHWKIVSELVGTRSYSQCNQKWRNNPTCLWEMKEASRWTAKENIELIEAVYNTQESHEGNIDWEEILRSWPNPSEVSPQYLSIKWSLLKRRYLENVLNMDFEDVVDHLFNVVRPKLTAKLKNTREYIEDARRHLAEGKLPHKC